MRRGSFLPQVWESLPRPDDFLMHLKYKAGIDRPLRPQEDTVEIYTAWSTGAVTMGADGETTTAR
jgi:hypothetical protein